MKFILILLVTLQTLFALTLEAPTFIPVVLKKHIYSLCGGENISPEILVYNIPSKSKSLALTIFDPDAPRPQGWWHWAIFNLPINNKIKEGIAADAFLQLKNDYGNFGYGGPCPPKGKPHHYIVTLYALKEKVNFPKETPILKALGIIKPLILEKAKIIGIYQRK